MSTPSIQTLRTDAQQVLNLDSISAVRSVVAATLANANAGTPLNPNLTTQQLWNEFYQIITQPKSDIESIIANQLMKFLYAPPAPGGVGANGQVIFNDGGVLAGDPQFLWNKTTNLLTVTGSATITGALTVDTTTLVVDTANDRVGVGTVSPTASFHTKSDGVVSGAGWTAIGRFNNVANSKGIDLGYNPSNSNAVLSALTAGATSGFEFWSFDGSWSNRMTLNSTGLTVLNGNVILGTSGKGIDFSATAGTGTSELLNDYEEGTFVPNIAGTTPTYTTQIGRYTKIGNRVLFTIRLTINNAGNGSDSVIYGLPFANTSTAPCPTVVGYFANLKTNAAFLTGYVDQSVSYLNMTGTTGSVGTIINGFGVIGNGTDLSISGQYFVA